MVLTSFLEVDPKSHFSLQNLPYGIYTPASGGARRIGVALGDNVIDLAALSDAGFFTGPHLQGSRCFHQAGGLPRCIRASAVPKVSHSAPHPKAFCDLQETLNSFMSLGRYAWWEARRTLTRLLSRSEGALRDNKNLLEAAVTPLVSLCLASCNQQRHLSMLDCNPGLKADATLYLPADIGDYTDFYASKEHASNCGTMFRGKGNELQENW